MKHTLLVNSAGVENRGTYFAATPERAYLDVLYLNKDYDFTNLRPLDIKKIEEFLPIYNNKRMARKVKEHFAAFHKKEETNI